MRNTFKENEAANSYHSLSLALSLSHLHLFFISIYPMNFPRSFLFLSLFSYWLSAHSTFQYSRQHVREQHTQNLNNYTFIHMYNTYILRCTKSNALYIYTSTIYFSLQAFPYFHLHLDLREYLFCIAWNGARKSLLNIPSLFRRDKFSKELLVINVSFENYCTTVFILSRHINNKIWQ